MVRVDAIRTWAEGITGAAPAVGKVIGYERADDVSVVVYRDSANHVREQCTGGFCVIAGYSTDLTPNATTASDITAYNRADGTSAVVYRNSNNHLMEIWRNGSSWITSDLSLNANAAPATGNPAAYARSDNHNVVVYRGSDNHIHELDLPPGSPSWHDSDLTWLSGAPMAASNAVGYVRADATNAVVFRSYDGHIREMKLTNGWSSDDLTSLTNAPNAIGTPRPYSRSDGYSAVVYRSSDGHIRELCLSAESTRWSLGDLTALTNAPNADSDPVAYVRRDGWNAVIYRGKDNHIYELGLAPGTNNWQMGDLSSITGAPAATGTPSGFVNIDGSSVVVFQSSGDNHIRYLPLGVSGGWGASDLTSR
jgi:hypothetical protein